MITLHQFSAMLLQSLQHGIETFHKEISDDPTTQNRLEIAIITYGSEVTVIQQPAN